jgi:hypothetical protein
MVSAKGKENMTPDWKDKENYVRQVLSKKLGTRLAERRVRLRGTQKFYKFDFVSPDGSIVGEVKTSKPRKSGKKPHGKIANTSEACLFLIAAEGANRKLLVLTDKEFYSIYTQQRQARIAEAFGLELLLVEC